MGYKPIIIDPLICQRKCRSVASCIRTVSTLWTSEEFSTDEVLADASPSDAATWPKAVETELC